MRLLLALVLCLALGAPAHAQSGGTILPNAQQQFVDGNGVPLSGGKVYTYVPATTTPKLTWQNQPLTQPNTNPIILDSAGRATIWGTGSYREVVQDQAGNTIWDLVTVAPSPPVIPPSPPPAPTYFGQSLTVDRLVTLPIPGGATTVVFDSFEFDTIGGYSTITGTFAPNKRGVYLVTTTLYLSGLPTQGGQCNAALWRNGVVSRLASSATFAAQDIPRTLDSVTVTGIFQLNGSGDNLQVKVNCTEALVVDVTGGADLSYFSAIWLGPY